MKKMLIVFGALLLGGCSVLQSLPSESNTQKIEIACATTGSSIRVLTIARANGKLSPSAVRAVNVAIATVSPVCSNKKVPSLSNARQAEILGAVGALNAWAQPYKGKTS